MKNITMSDVAREAGISRQAVSDILNNRNVIKVSDATRERVLETVKRLNYKPNYQAKSLKEGKTSCIGLMGASHILNLRLQYFADLAGAIDLEMIQTKSSYSLLIFGAGKGEAGKSAMEMIRKGLVDGLLVTMLSEEIEFVTNILAPQLERLGIPFVAIHNRVGKFPFPNVGVDLGEGMYRLVRHLLENGYRDVRLYVRGKGSITGTDIGTSFDRALGEAGLVADASRVFYAPGQALLKMYDDAYTFATNLKEIPEAIICEADEQAFGMIHGLRARGYRVPEDVAVAARTSSLPNPMLGKELTCMVHPVREKCHAALEMLHELMGKNYGDNVNLNRILIPEIQTGKTIVTNKEGSNT